MTPASVASEKVEAHIGYDRLAIVARDEEPGSDVPILSNGRPASRCAIVVHLAELADGTTGVQSPVVLEVDVRVGVVCRLERQAVRGPVLPPVVVELKPVVEQPLLSIEQSDPGVPRHLVRPPQKAKVVD